jgi:hypothetical protein
MTILTIEIDDDLLARARQLAAARSMSVPEMVQRLLRVVAEPPLQHGDLPPITRQAAGMLPPMTDEQVRETLDERRARKYGSQ